MDTKSGRKSKSVKVEDSFHILKLPVFQIISQPKGPRGAKNLDKIKINHFFVLDKGLELALTNVRNDGFKKVKAIQMKEQYPIFCPKCGKKERRTSSV